jgi:hypothetical protein
MHRRFFRLATVFLWLALPLAALQYTQVWNQLPVRVATHFNAAGQADGWMSRGEAVNFAVGFMAFLLAIFTVLLLYIAHCRVDAFSWTMLGFCALVLGVMVEVNHSIVNYNLRGTPLQLGAALIAIPIALILPIAIYIAVRREPPLLPSTGPLAADLLVEETHSGRPWTLILLLVLILPAIAVASHPMAMIPMILMGLIALTVGAMAWSGFQYRFLRHGVEIRMLGFRMRSIPRQSIVSYSVEPWAFARGYGIRGVGNTRAYVWGNKVVHIKTSNGEVFLGHSDPERIVHDLDRVMSR